MYVCFTRKKGDGLFLDCCHEVAKLFPKIEFEGMIVDNACMQVRIAIAPYFTKTWFGKHLIVNDG